jgi:CHAT domain-containing protein
VSPDGALARMSFAALPGERPGEYLIEDLAIGVLPVPQLLPELTAPAAPADGASPSLLLIGNVNHDAAPGHAESGRLSRLAGRAERTARWPPLPETGAEIAAIREAFEKRFPHDRWKSRGGDEAVVDRVRAELGRYRYVHIATHGFFAPSEVPSVLAAPQGHQAAGDALARRAVAGYHPGLLSGLVLAGANRPPEPGEEDGILTALEVAELDLGRVELATLSACDTGLGKSAGGEGVLGLQRAFQVAGARSVVATLWHIRDDAARALMTEFYDNLWQKKMPKLRALREAQLSILRHGADRGLESADRPADARGRLPPYCWAPFVLSGQWR